MRAIAVIPARGGSKRISGKNVRPFAGRPLVAHSIGAALASGVFDVVHVSTDDDAIRDVALDAGASVPFLRDAALADDTTGVFEVLRWVLHELSGVGEAFDVACLLMATAPLIDAGDLRAAVEEHRRRADGRATLAVSGYPAPTQWAFRVGVDGALTPVQPEAQAVRSQDLEPHVYDSGTFAIFDAGPILAGGDAGPFVAYALPAWKAVDIDDEEDLLLAEVLWRGRRALGI